MVRENILLLVLFFASVFCTTDILWVSPPNNELVRITMFAVGDVVSFRRGLVTTGHKSRPIPQLQCVASDVAVDCAYQFKRVDCTCTNIFSDKGCAFDCAPVFSNGTTKQDSEMALRMHIMNISCEFVMDSFLVTVTGSCGLIYTLNATTTASVVCLREDIRHHVTWLSLFAVLVTLARYMWFH